MRALLVRRFRKGEVERLRQTARRGKSAEHARWAGIVLARGVKGIKALQCAEIFDCSLNTVANVVRRWNAKGMGMFLPPEGTGRPATFTDRERRAVVALAKAPPQAVGKPWNQWSLHKIVDAATGLELVAEISHETVRKWLKEAGISCQRMKTWKHSDDPEYARKKSG
jgi:transposase